METTVPAPALADGIGEYVDAFRELAAAGGDRSTSRLRSDRAAGIFALPDAPAMESFTTFLVAEGQEIALRIHRPLATGPLPAIVYFHGGGFIAGSIESFDCVAHALASRCGALVVSVQYRRLPENRYADARDDCRAAFEWTVAHAGVLGVDPRSIAVAGDSVGALLAMVTARSARDAGISAAAQLLFYGAYSMEPGRPCYTQGSDPLLNADRVEAVVAAYRATEAASPLAGTFAGLPPALIVGAQHDPLCAESIELAEAMQRAGVAVTARVAPGMIHGYLRAARFSRPVREELASIATDFTTLIKRKPNQEPA